MKKVSVVNWLKFLVLTVMDAVVFVLCVDQGLTPVTIVGAVYVALRVFAFDGFQLVQSCGPMASIVDESITEAVEKSRLRIETKESEEKVIET